MAKSFIGGFKYPLHLAGKAHDEISPATTRIYFENGYAYATDRLILVRFALADLLFAQGDLADLEKKSLSLDAFKSLYWTREQPTICKDGIQLGEILYKFKEEEKPPLGYEKVIDTARTAVVATERVKLRVDNLTRLGEILDPAGQGLTLEMHGHNQVITATPPDKDIDAMGLLMTMWLNKQ